MKIESDLVIRHIADEIVLIPTGKAGLKNPGIITLTESGEMLVKKLQEGCDMEDLVDCLTAEYEVEQAQAKEDVKRFLGKLEERGLIGGN